MTVANTKRNTALKSLFILSLVALSFISTQSVSAATAQELKIQELEEKVMELRELLLERRGIPILTEAVPLRAEIGEPVIIKGRGFGTQTLDIFFDDYTGPVNVEPVSDALIAFKIPSYFGMKGACEWTSNGQICIAPQIALEPEFETYDVSVRTKTGYSNTVKLKIVEEK